MKYLNESMTVVDSSYSVSNLCTCYRICRETNYIYVSGYHKRFDWNTYLNEELCLPVPYDLFSAVNNVLLCSRCI